MADPLPNETLKHIQRPLRLTLLGLWVERIARGFWPLWSLLLAVITAMAFGLHDHLSLRAFWAVAITVGVAAVLALVWVVRNFTKPRQSDALLRLDAQMPGRPLASLADNQAIGARDPASAALWRAHRARMQAAAAAAKPVPPDLKLACFDPYALRYAALTGFVVAVLFGSFDRLGAVALLASGGGQGMAAGPAWEGWAQPPSYTGKPTVYLNDFRGDHLELPIGTKLQFRAYSGSDPLEISETISGAAQAVSSPDVAGSIREVLLLQNGSLEIDGPGGRAWTFAALPDGRPKIALEGVISRDADGRFKQIFTAEDDYGVVGGQVKISLDLSAIVRRYGLVVAPEAAPVVELDLPMPVTGDRAQFKETLLDDLSQHMLANMPVTMAFTLRDAAGQDSDIVVQNVVLPGKRFFDPLAAAVIEMRRDLLWNPANAPRVTQILKAITFDPESLIRNERAYLRLRVVMRQLDTAGPALSGPSRDEIAQELWQIALLVEEGDLASAMQRLQRAQDRLDEAIRNGADAAEIDHLMREFRQALNDYMSQLAEESARNPDSQLSENMEGMEMSGDQLQEMLNRLQQLMEEGRTAEAQQLMEMLRQLMENMRVTQGEGGQGQGQGGQAMRNLDETLREQQGLSDDAFRDLQGAPNAENDEGEGRNLAERQGDLRNRLDLLGRGRLPGEGSTEGEAGRQELDRAGRAMREAEEALRRGDLSGALDRQAEAMEAMREGMRNFGEALAQEQREGQGADGQQGQSAESGDQPGQRDPLGRLPGEGARIGSDGNLLQGQDIYRRAQGLLDEIRRRTGEQLRPEDEREYLRRLLDLF